MNGESGRTALNWIDAADPRPDYYRNFGIYPANAHNNEVDADFKNNSQLNWDAMYKANQYNNPDYVDADGKNHGKHARYMLEDRRRDVEQIIADVNIQHDLNKNIQLVGGANYNSYKAHTYTLVDDLMGADFIWNIDKFADRQDPKVILTNQQRIDRVQNDYDYYLEHGEAQKLKEGDVYGHDYDAHVDKISGFAQANFSYDKFDYYASLGLVQTTMWRDSKVRKGLFKHNSLGESEKLNYFNYAAKAGVTYKKDGKNYFSANAGYMTKAQSFRNVFLSPRTRHTSLNDKGQYNDEKIMTADLGYAYRSPNFKLKANAYYTKFMDQIKTMGFYHDESRTFVNSIQSGVDKTHMGIEIGFDYKLLDALSLVGAIAVGEHTIDSRPMLTMIADNNDKFVVENEHVYVMDFKETGYPQQAYTVGLKYSSDKYWWVGVNANYYREMYLSYSPLRRTKAAFEQYESSENFGDEYESSELFTGLLQKVTAQTKLDDQFTLDLNIGKSWRIDYKYYININLSVSNVLNNTEFITGGYEQSRIKTDSKYESEYDISQFPPKLYYAYGRNFFLNMSFRF